MRNGHNGHERVAITNQKEMTRAKARLAQIGVAVSEATIRQNSKGWSLKVEVPLESPEAVENFVTIMANARINPA